MLLYIQHMLVNELSDAAHFVEFKIDWYLYYTFICGYFVLFLLMYSFRLSLTNFEYLVGILFCNWYMELIVYLFALIFSTTPFLYFT